MNHPGKHGGGRIHVVSEGFIMYRSVWMLCGCLAMTIAGCGLSVKKPSRLVLPRLKRR